MQRHFYPNLTLEYVLEPVLLIVRVEKNDPSLKSQPAVDIL